ncbi:centriole, cilia and spindle-associated protein [Mastacembelus armatus]|uniref:Centriole, cilia and spindle-associated protein b n=1 Tax=Mastacembelus armatus TaxID=205130 RepID=A0A3Q3N0L4_9TELE|nr:centriole, cilia and spindle-associated protein [Mastacembelus armatus]
MVTKRIRSEYMKKFTDPKWETYNKCYEEMLKYRLTRRMLEHTHKPWFWSGSDSDSDSGGRSTTPTGRKQRSEAELEECEGVRMDTQQEQQTRTDGSVHKVPFQGEEEKEEKASLQKSTDHGIQLNTVRLTSVPEVKREEQQASSSQPSKWSTIPYTEQDQKINTGGPQPQQSKPSKSSKQAWRSQRVRPLSSRQPKEDKESRHPFALYGSGERDADIAGRKTHNVGPASSTNEIHESALRAKTRREVERHIQTQKTKQQRAKSAVLDKARKLLQPEFNPWLTEYMRCFSARSR